MGTTIHPEQPLLQAVVSLLPLLCMEALTAGTDTSSPWHCSLQVPSQHLHCQQQSQSIQNVILEVC